MDKKESKILSSLWDAIHIISMTYDPSRDKNIGISLKCFYYALIKLIPFGMDINSIKFATEYPIDNYLSSSVKAFQWGYLWHDYINKALNKKGGISLEEARKKYDNKKLTKDVWGSKIWILIHTIAKYLPKNPTKEQKELFYDMLKCLRLLLPCGKCRNHLTLNLKQYNYRDYYANRDTIFLYTNILHNVVNHSLRKKQMNVEIAWDLY